MFVFNTLKEIPSYLNKSIFNDSFLNYIENGKYRSISSQKFVENVYKLSHAFSKVGVKKGTTVAIVSNSSPFWLMVDYALQDLGAISVPIFANIAEENFIYQLNNADIKYIYIASQDKYDQIKDNISSLKLVITHNVNCNNINSVDFFDFINDEAKKSMTTVLENDTATIIYTSGSTGTPKGVELSHKNILTQLRNTSKYFPLLNTDKALSFLPLAHIFERMVMSHYLTSGLSIYFADNIDNVGNLIKEVKPSIMTVVPRLLDKMSIKMHDKIQSYSPLKKFLGSLALSEADNKELETRTIFTPLFERLVYSKLLEALGGNMRFVICGGAPLSTKTERFFTNIGLNIYQGYGLTETSPVISANSPNNKKPFTCGKAFDNVEVMIAKDGELYTRGDCEMKTYHKDIEKTRDVLSAEGWFHTGDLASMDNEGYITINGRKKELFKTSTGKYISAIHIEELLTQNRWCDYAVIIADNKPFVSAIIFLDSVVMKNYAVRKNLKYSDLSDLYNTKKVKDLIAKVIKRANKHLNYEEKVKKYHIGIDEPSIENLMLTPSMKVSRGGVYKKYEYIINSLYGEES